jgi:hypothetical protein
VNCTAETRSGIHYEHKIGGQRRTFMFIFRVQAPNIISKLDKKYTHFLGRDAQGGADFENPRLHGHADNDGVTRIENKLQNDEKQRHQ